MLHHQVQVWGRGWHICPTHPSRSRGQGCFPTLQCTTEPSRKVLIIITATATFPSTGRHCPRQQHRDINTAIKLREGTTDQPAVGRLQASEAGTGSQPSSHSSYLPACPYQEALFPAFSWGQCWAVDDFLLHSPSPQHLLFNPVPPAHSSHTPHTQPSLPYQLHLGPQTFQDPMRSFSLLLWGKEKSGIRQGFRLAAAPLE